MLMPPVGDEIEYREKWKYIRHSELIRYRAVQWYIGIVGVLLGFIYGEPTGPLPSDIRPLVLTFLVGYSLFLAAFLIHRKEAYEIRSERVEQLENRKTVSLAFHPWVGVFAWYFYGFALLGSFLGFLWGWETFAGGQGNPVGSLPAWVSAGGFIGLVGGYFVFQMRRFSEMLREAFPKRYGYGEET